MISFKKDLTLNIWYILKVYISLYRQIKIVTHSKKLKLWTIFYFSETMEAN